MGAKVGFARADISGCAAAASARYGPSEAGLVYMEGPEARTLVVALDIMQLSREFCRDLRHEVAAATGLDAREVITHCTHVHSSPDENLIRARGVRTLAGDVSPAASAAMRSARPVLVELVEARPPHRLSICRRRTVEGSAGAFTVWTGFEMAGDRPDAGATVRERMRGMLRSDEAHASLAGPVWYERPVDDLVQMILFRDPGGSHAPTGGILRYSAHAVAACHSPVRHLGGGFPYFAREAVSRELSCPCVFLTGPSGDIAPVEVRPCPVIRRESPGPGPFVPPPYPTPEAAVDDARRQGEAVARVALDAVGSGTGGAGIHPLDEVRCAVRECELEIRPSVTETADEARELGVERWREFEAARAEDARAAELRPLADAWLEAHYMPAFFEEFYYASRDEVRSRRVTIELPHIELGEILVAGFPGESCQEATSLMRASTPGPLVTVTEMNGDAGYMAAAWDFPGGDYEVNCSIITPGGLEKLVEAHARG